MTVSILTEALEPPHCGDAGVYLQFSGQVLLGIIDGLGHGQHAQIAAQAAAAAVRRFQRKPLTDIFRESNRLLINTRGVAMGLALLNPEKSLLTYAGIGNTRAMVLHRESLKLSRLSGNYGIVGGGYKQLRLESVSVAEGDLILLFSDGLTENGNLDDYEGSLLDDVQRLAPLLIQDWAQSKDDRGLLVFRIEK